MVIEMVPLKSSNLKCAGYASHSLFITFQANRTYRYLDCPPVIFKLLTEAESPGKFFEAEIRPVLKYEIIDPSLWQVKEGRKAS